MKDLIDYKNTQIEALQNDRHLNLKRIEQLETYIFELCMEDCPKDYKTIIMREILL
jgi:hypothetical protein